MTRVYTVEKLDTNTEVFVCTLTRSARASARLTATLVNDVRCGKKVSNIHVENYGVDFVGTYFVDEVERFLHRVTNYILAPRTLELFNAGSDVV